jgi:hypothetical protein
MEKQLYETFSSSHVTDDMLAEAAKLFCENYGTWGKQSDRPGKLSESLIHRLRAGVFNVIFDF